MQFRVSGIHFAEVGRCARNLWRDRAPRRLPYPLRRQTSGGVQNNNIQRLREQMTSKNLDCCPRSVASAKNRDT
jgi:hypothetical protein